MRTTENQGFLLKNHEDGLRELKIAKKEEKSTLNQTG
jgi:hypothetical protein